jgi:predicted nucleic acid-binding protein
MNPLVIDASIAVKWFLPEDGSDEALIIRNRFVDREYHLIAPDLMLSEFVNVLWKRREFVEEATSLDIISDLLALGIDLVPSEQFIVRAYKLGRQYSRTVYDSLYLALAESRSCDMVTADSRLYNAVEKHLPFVHLLGDWKPAEAE